MAVAALVAWVATAVGGLVLLGTWLLRHGPEQHRTGRSRFAPRLIFSHLGLAAAGLAVWVVALASGRGGLRWVSVALLPLVAALGILMYLKWLGGRGAHPDRTELHRPAEQHFPVLIVSLHGLFAVVTVVLVVLAAAGVGT